MKFTNPNNNKNKKNAATMPMSIHNSVSGLFASGIAISYSFGCGGCAAVFFRIVNAYHGTNKETDDTAYNNSY